jgi:hypothetical protein
MPVNCSTLCVIGFGRASTSRDPAGMAARTLAQEAREDGSAEDDGGEVDHCGVWCGVGEPVDCFGEYGARRQVDLTGQDNVGAPSPGHDGHREEEGVRI